MVERRSPYNADKAKQCYLSYDTNPCENLDKNLLFQRFLAKFFYDSYKPKKIFVGDEYIDVTKGTLFDIEILTYDFDGMHSKPIDPSQHTRLVCGAIVFDNNEIMRVDFRESYPNSVVRYSFSENNDLAKLRQKMQDSKKILC